MCLIKNEMFITETTKKQYIEIGFNFLPKWKRSFDIFHLLEYI